MDRSTRFSWDDLDPHDRTRMNSAFDEPEDDWELDLPEPPKVRRKKRQTKSLSSVEKRGNVEMSAKPKAD
ncbi:hypothetical protein Pla110_06060 [Polystyrenella longa]|uniref:Uncharacterized protein n=1 Tax=Polystyrenella longa TaxID=2528007 RepID=A0A518CI52_9PLAN|nr:hypothetical protein [Polystyrenella longa]QDU78902.1 hypothetical protein Pla110_06060 [Polystyrenella longa]